MRSPLGLAVAILSIFGTSGVQAQDSTFKEIDAAVQKKLAPAIKRENLDKITIGAFKWHNGKSATMGAGLAQQFAVSLSKQNINVVPKSSAELTGILESIVDPQSDEPAVRLTITLTIEGKEALLVKRLIFGEQEVPALEGTNVTFPPKASDRERTQLVIAARKPQPQLQDATKVFSPDRKVSVEMLLSKDKKPFEARKLDTTGMYPVEAGETYQIKVANHFDHEIAVRLTIDGLAWDQFASFDGKAPEDPVLLLVPANGSSIVKGWAMSKDKSSPFDVASFPLGAIGQRTEMGIITLSYYSSWIKGQIAPAGEENAEARRSILGTERVREQRDSFTVVERQLGSLRGVFSVRYGAAK